MAIASAGSSTRRSGTRRATSTIRSRRRKTSATTCSTYAARGVCRQCALRIPPRSVARECRAAGHVPTRVTTVELELGAATAFERALRSRQSKLQSETLWYRMIAGGTAPRYVRLRPQLSYASLASAAHEQALPDEANSFVAKQTIEILTLRPTMSYRLTPARQ